MNAPRSTFAARAALPLLALVLALANAALAWRLWLAPRAEPDASAPAVLEPGTPQREAREAAAQRGAVREESAASSAASAAASSGAPARGGVVSAAASPGAAEREREARAPQPAPPLEGTLLFGRVRSSDGRMLSGGVGWVYGSGLAKPLATFRPREGGHYAVAGLPSGTLRLRLRAEGHSELEQLLEVSAGTAELERDLVLERTWILALKLVTPEGRPLHAALAERGWARSDELAAVATTWEPSGDLPSSAARELSYGVPRWVSAQGPSAFGAKPQVSRDHAGHFELAELRPLFVSVLLRTALLVTSRVEPGQAELVLTIPVERVEERLATLRLRVLDARTRTPLASAEVGLHLRGTFGSGTQVDAEGRVELARRAPGLWRLSISAEGYASAVSDVELPPGQVLDLGDQLLTAPVDVRVRCTEVSGDAKALSVSARSLDDPGHPQIAPHTLRLQRDGELFTARLPEGRFLLRATGAGTASLAVDTRTLDAEPIVLPLGPEGLLRPRLAKPDELLHLTVLDASGNRIASDWIPSGPPPTWRVPVGELRLLMELRSGERRERLVEVPASGLEIVLPE